MPENVTDPRELSLGESHGCSARRNACWGNRSSGQSTVLDREFPVLSAGRNHTCGLAYDPDGNRHPSQPVGEAVCWGMGSRAGVSEGAEDYDQAVPPEGVFTDISAGRNYTCALGLERGRAICWGNNDAAQTEPGDSVFALIDTATLAPEDRGAGWSCGVTPLGNIECWGADPSDLEFGDETSAPRDESSPPAATELAVGMFHGCARTEDGDLRCWGRRGDRLRPPTDQVWGIDAGDHYTCGIRRDGSLACWGGGDDQMFERSRRDPTRDVPAGRFRQIATGAAHACAVGFDDRLTCWGEEWFGEATPPDGTFRTVTVGGAHSCGLRDDGTVECWGVDQDDASGRLARRAEEYDSGQTDPPEGPFESIDAGRYHTCGIRADDRRVVCWGRGTDEGQPDEQERGAFDFEQSVAPDGRFEKVSAGAAHTCAVRESGEMACWGLGSRLDENEGEYDFDQATPPDGTFIDVEVSALTSCGLREDGQIVCWGIGDRLRESEGDFEYKHLDYNQAVTPDGFVE
jgi:hypothetical protein